MAKKTTTRSKTAEPKAEAQEAPAPAPKPRARAVAAPKAKAKVVAKAAPLPTPVSAPDEPSDEEIRLRAYHRYLERGGGHGMDFEDWLDAKRDLQNKK